jgi:hypothetical protein
MFKYVCVKTSVSVNDRLSGMVFAELIQSVPRYMMMVMFEQVSYDGKLS